VNIRKTVTAIALCAATTLGLVACDPATTPESSPAASAGTVATTAPASASAGSEVPDFVGMGLQSAQDAAQAAGFDRLTSHDASDQDRMQILDRNWTVCDQTPAAGTSTSTSTTIDMGAVKTDETCPANATTAPAPTTTRATPRPKPVPTHTATTHRPVATHTAATTSGGSSSGGTSTHTEPPVEDHGGATALCNDGTFSYSAHHQGTCSHHHGVAEFYN
jgi:beta-lactam-binding protein with PASTA domain